MQRVQIYTDIHKKVLNRKKVAEGIEFLCVYDRKIGSSKKRLILRRYGVEKEFFINLNKPTYICLKDGIEVKNFDEAIENDEVLVFSALEMIEICKEIGYFSEVNDNTIASVVKFFIGQYDSPDYACGEEWGNKIKCILNSHEIDSFHEWEELVGYEDRPSFFDFSSDFSVRIYNCDTTGIESAIYGKNSDLESALYVINKSERLMNAVTYLLASGITEDSLNIIWNYLVTYNHQDSFIETMYFSDWNDYNLNELMEKYNIVDDLVTSQDWDELVKTEDYNFLSSNTCSLRVGDKYKMAMAVNDDSDDENAIAVVVPIDCPLTPPEIVCAGESIDKVENNWAVKNKICIF
ncbi:MAG: hypothetical protein K6A34_01765 [Methanobrevibacter sp.]|nr:hypothetical protein [Methanobrevibacter sp.]